jgi:3-hydroxybutyrate dehydrogenase
MNLKGKSAIVSGAANDIGGTIAELLASQGVAVAIVDENKDAAQWVATTIESAGGRAMGVVMDVNNEVAVARATDRVARAFGGIDILVSVLGAQIQGAFLATKAAVKYMYADDRGGTVIYMGSTRSPIASPGEPADAAIKPGLLELARALAREGAAHNVRSHVVLSAPLAHKPRPKPTRGRRRTVDGIFTTVEETVLFLCESPSIALSGQSFVVSDGWFVQ